MPRDPAEDKARLQAVYAIAQAGRHGEAADAAQLALADGLEHPLLFNLAALKFEQQDQLDQAEKLLRRALSMDPADVGALNALGLCLLRLERPAEALGLFDALLQSNPQFAFAHASLGNCLLALGLIVEAEASYHRALAVDAAQGVALVGLAHLSSSRGAYDDARMWAEKALAVLPGHPDAVMSLASVELAERNVFGAETRLRTMLADGRLSPLERAYAHGLLGDVLDAKNYVDGALEAYTTCNEGLGRIYASQYSNSNDAQKFVQVLRGRFSSARPDVWKSRPSADARTTGAADHVFLLGFPRSGTTLLEVILEGHPHIVSLEENESLIDSVREYFMQPADLERIASADSRTLERLRAAYWKNVAIAGADVLGKMFVDKNPLNSLKLPMIARLFPDAKILFACRDPRDIVLSCFRHRFKMSAPIYELLSLEGAARYYDALMHLVMKFFSLLPLQVCLIRHEDVVSEFKREMSRVCQFLRVEWDPAMGDFALRTLKREALTPSTAQLAKGLSTEGLGHWRRYRSQMSPVFPLLAPWVRQFDYQEA